MGSPVLSVETTTGYCTLVRDSKQEPHTKPLSDSRPLEMFWENKYPFKLPNLGESNASRKHTEFGDVTWVGCPGAMADIILSLKTVSRSQSQFSFTNILQSNSDG